MTAKEKMKKAVAKRDNGAVANKPKTIMDYIQDMTPEISKALPSHLKPERLARIVTTEIRRNPQLMKCTRESLLGALMLSAQLGLEPGPLGHVYYIPYNNRKQGVMECQFILGYKGMIDLARRSGHIESIDAQVVYENDEFEFEYGLNPNLTHKPALVDRGKAIAYYAVAKFKDGGFQMKVMGKDDVERIRSRSMAKNFGPWKTDYDEMAKKSVIRAMFKYLPVSNEIMRYSEKDDVVKTDIHADEGETTTFIDVTPEPMPELPEQASTNDEPPSTGDDMLDSMRVDFPDEFTQAVKEIGEPTAPDIIDKIKKRIGEMLDQAAA